MKHRHLLASLICAAAVAVIPMHASAQAKREKVTITWGGDALHYYPALVARALGMFEAEGLDVEWVKISSGTRQAASVMGGSAELTTLALFHVIKAASKGGDLVAIATVFDVYGMTMLLSNDAIARSGIEASMPIDEKVKRLKGLKIGISSPGSSTDAFVRSLFLARGMDPDAQVKLQPFGAGASILASFEKGLSDGFVFPAPIPQMAQTKGLGFTVIDPFTGEVPELIGVPYVVLATTRATLMSNPEAVRGTTRALTKAMRFVREKPEESVKLIRQYFPKVEDKVFYEAATTYAKGTPKTPLISRQQVEQTIKWMNLGAKQPTTAKYEAVVAPEAATAAARELLK